MIARWAGFQSPLAEGIIRFLAHKRALGRRFDTEDKQLRLFDRFLVQQLTRGEAGRASSWRRRSSIP